MKLMICKAKGKIDFMKPKILFRLIPLLFFLFPPVVGLVHAEKLRVAVAPVEGNYSQAMKEKVRLELERQLVTSGKLEVLDRNKLKELTEEMKLSLEGVIDPATMQNLGKITGVSVFLFPRIVSAWASSRRSLIPIVNEYEYVVRAGFELMLKLVKTETSQIIAADKVSGSFYSKKMAGEGGIPSKGAALAAAQSRALKNAGGLILGALFPIKVAYYNKTTGIVTLNRGKDTLHKGQVLTVYSLGEKIIDPDTGEVIGNDEEPIGKIKIIETRSKLSRARILKGYVKRASVCR